MTEEGSSTRRLEVGGWKTKESSIGRRAELARWNIQLDEIREIGRDLVVQCFKVKKKKKKNLCSKVHPKKHGWRSSTLSSSDWSACSCLSGGGLVIKTSICPVRSKESATLKTALT